MSRKKLPKSLSVEVTSLVDTNARRPTLEGHWLFFKYKRANIRPIVMDPQLNNLTGDAQRAYTGAQAELEASTPPNQITQSEARSRSGGRLDRDDEGRDGEQRYRRIRQPAIGSPGNRAEVEAAPALQNSDVNMVTGQPRTQSAMSESTSESMASVQASWNARLAQGAYGGGQSQGMTGSLGLQDDHSQVGWTPSQHGYGHPTSQMYGGYAGYSGNGQLQQPPYGYRYTDNIGLHWVWNQFTYSYEPDLAEEAAQHPLPPSTVSHHSGYAPSTASLEDRMQRLPTGQVRTTSRAARALIPKPWQNEALASLGSAGKARDARDLSPPNSMLIDMGVIILNTTAALQNPPPGREWICDMRTNHSTVASTCNRLHTRRAAPPTVQTR